MKVLFALNNDKISDAILKKYQSEYKQIISYKNVYYFNAILKELQKDKTYDRVVISEDLEPFANNNYDTIDKFIFEKLDKISDEATNVNGDNIEIILICSDRRNKSDEMFIKFFGIGVYNALIGTDRTIENVCKLINQPRTKKDAKVYYRIESSDVNYQAENENNVSEIEIENILRHFERLGKNEDQYIASFNNVVSQYTDNQLKIIIKYLPMRVKAVLEERSPKYQELLTFSNKINTDINQKSNIPFKRTKKEAIKKEEAIKVKMLDNETNKLNITKPIVIPSGIKKVSPKKIIETNNSKNIQNEINENIEEKVLKIEKETSANNKIQEKDIDNQESLKTNNEQTETVKRKRGRPRKNIPEPIDAKNIEVKPLKAEAIDVKPIEVEPLTAKPLEVEETKRKRGRPKKITTLEEKDEKDETKLKESNTQKDVELLNLNEKEQDKDVDLFNLNEKEQDEDVDLFNINEEEQDEDVDLFNINEEEQDEDIDLSNINEEEQDEDIDLSNLNEKEQDEDIDLSNIDKEEQDVDEDLFNINQVEKITNVENENLIKNQNQDKIDYEHFSTNYNVNKNNIIDTNPVINNNNTHSVFSQDKKIVAFVGTTKNGTSFVVNNLAQLLSERGISTAILDITKTKNAYYIYTKNEERLREIATNSIAKLEQGIAEGIKVNKNLTVYTSLPEQNIELTDIDLMLETLSKEHTIILIDTDFFTPVEIFDRAQEIYLVQSMDILTIQPLTDFLRNLKAKNILKQEKIKIVINKEQKVKSLNAKILIGGMANYNDPSMSFMTELFNREEVKYCTIPFEMQNYLKYLDGLVNCSISLKGYTKQFLNSLKNLADMVYPLLGKNKRKKNK